MRVAVLSGGRSSEHEVSVNSGASVSAGLRDAGHEVVEVRVEPGGRWLSAGTDVALRAAGGLLDVDVAFPVIHGPYGEDGVVQGTLEALDLPYVGSGVLASAITLDKLTFKRLLAFHGLPQVEFCSADEEGWEARVAELGFPLWVKPARLGSSVGITKVLESSELGAAIATARAHDSRVIIEASAEGREVECSVIGNEDPETSILGEIVAHADWYDYESKYTDGRMDLLAPAPIAEETTQGIRELAAAAFRVTGCRGMARCDFFITHSGEALVNELNTIPGFTTTSVFARLFEASGVSYPELCDRLLGYAVERYEAELKIRHQP